LDFSNFRLTCGHLETLASHGLEEPFFQLCCCVVSVFGSGYLSCLQNNPPENNVEPVPAKSEPVQLCDCVGFLLWFPPNLSCLQNNPPENNVEQFPPNLSCLQNNPTENNVEDLAGTRSTLFSGGLFWDRAGNSFWYYVHT
jgi:hypothetical protein